MQKISELLNILRWDKLDEDVESIQSNSPHLLNVLWANKESTKFLLDFLICFLKDDFNDPSLRSRNCLENKPTSKEIVSFLSSRMDEISEMALTRVRSDIQRQGIYRVFDDSEILLKVQSISEKKDVKDQFKCLMNLGLL